MADCERSDPIGIAQDVNAWTSLAYAAVAVALLAGVSSKKLFRSAALLAFLSLAEAVGSVLFHGDPSDVGQWIHDVALLGMLGVVTGAHVGRLWGMIDRGAWIGGLAVTISVGLVHPVAADAVNGSAGVLLAVAVLAELVARRRGEPAMVRLGAIFVFALAGATWVLGTTDSPVCSPDSIVQFHGLWHLLSALAVFVWADRALATAGPQLGSGIGRLYSDRVVGLVAIILVRGFHRDVDIEGRSSIPTDRPVVLVANHGNGFVDPAVMAAALRRLPRFIAKASLWKILPARVLLDAVAVLPVYRRADGDDPRGNDRMFAASTDALARVDRVAIFPEGTTGDRAGLDRVRSGAARIALGARGAGVGNILIVPIGFAFESRVETRSRVAVTIGDPIDLDEWCATQVSLDERAATHALTEAIATQLVAVSPVYSSVDEREQLRMAAEVELRSRDRRARTPSFGAVERRASMIAAASSEQRQRVIAALSDHVLRRTMVGLGDEAMGEGTMRVGLGALLLAAGALFFAGPFLLTVMLVHLPALVLVRLAVSSVDSTATKGTVRLLTGAAAMLATWWIVAAVLFDGVLAVTSAMVVLGVSGACAMFVWGWLRSGLSTIRRWLRERDRRALVDGLLVSRSELIEAIGDAVVDVSEPDQV
ncbi:MAG: 1-acyl-sn-glycerol-3-phosphate acyltransferase [Acidobacteria bacterium]|nr:1-acyl-sn-glycerol-3-phosphate acyltransferase [Acidobacteriota bacterium]